MRVIHKYEIKARGFTIIEMSEWAVILDAMIIDERLFIWAELVPDRDKKLVERVFFLSNTGQAYDNRGNQPDRCNQYSTYQHIRTVRFSNGTVQHLFEARDKVKK